MAELYLVEFRGSRREYYYNSYYHTLDGVKWVIVQAERGEDIGSLSHKVEAEMRFSAESRPRSILRPASPDDQAAYEQLQQKEPVFQKQVMETINRHGLPMRVVGLECQLDGNKMTVYFTADHRVDFRELVKDLASQYRTRIELRQIGVRDEARRIGGYGICGRRQCCNTFIREFDPISTQHARDQDLPLNPSKISGNCGRLLCCLRYEIALYRECKQHFPPVGTPVKTKHGDGTLERIDVFNREALILNPEDRSSFRCAAEDIIERTAETAAPDKKPDPSLQEYEINGDEAAKEEALKKLDDSD